MGKVISSAIALILILFLVLGWWWSREPSAFVVADIAVQKAAQEDTQTVIGYATTATLIEVSRTMLEKPGGYLSNDVTPPSIFLDNIPNWEFGVLTQVRDLARALRNDISRSQSQSVEDTDLAEGEPQFSFDSKSWLFPPTEGEYKDGIVAFERYLTRLADPEEQSAQFFARADNLRDWLALVEKRLGSLAQRLSASVGQTRINTDLAGDAGATQSTAKPSEVEVKTPWLEIDDVFYESRGASWALVHFLKAVEIDFQQVLEKKNALVSLRQIIRELESTQETVWSPMILNGSGFSLVANHSLVMASYISSANAAVIDLRALLEQG
ncbi:MAG: DUF2333 family protein [Pseudomonadota bacterium]